jgi:hypothetical protein
VSLKECGSRSLQSMSRFILAAQSLCQSCVYTSVISWHCLKGRGPLFTNRQENTWSQRSRFKLYFIMCTDRARRMLEQPSTFSLLVYEGVSESFQTGRLEPELQTVQLSATRCSFIAVLWVSLVSFAVITLFCCFSTNFYRCRCIFLYRLSPETFGYTLVYIKTELETNIKIAGYCKRLSSDETLMDMYHL